MDEIIEELYDSASHLRVQFVNLDGTKAMYEGKPLNFELSERLKPFDADRIREYIELHRLEAHLIFPK